MSPNVPQPTDRDVTALLHAWSEGDLDARERLMPVVYDELRRRAAACLRRERKAHTLQPTALVHEAYLRLVDQRHPAWKNRAQFFAVSAAINLGPVLNTSFIEASPALSRDEHWLFFHSNRSGNMDIWVSHRTHTHDDFGWGPPVNVGAAVNSSFEESMGGFLDGDDTRASRIFFASNRPSGVGGFDLYESPIHADGTFGQATLVFELSSTVADPGLMVSPTGLEAFFYSARPGGRGGQDLWTATRETVLDGWSGLVNLGSVVNSSTIDQRLYLSSDRETLFFASDRPGGAGGLDLYVTTRERRGGRGK